MRRKEIAGNRISPIVGRCKATTVLIDLIIHVKIKKPRYVPPELQLLHNYKSQLFRKSQSPCNPTGPIPEQPRLSASVLKIAR